MWTVADYGIISRNRGAVGHIVKEMFMSGKRLRSLLLMLVCTMLLSFGVFGSDVFAWTETTKRDLVITGGEEGVHWNYDVADQGSFVIIEPGSYTVSMAPDVKTTQQTISVRDTTGGEVNLTLNNVTIETSTCGDSIICLCNNKVNLILKGTNTLRYYGSEENESCISYHPGGALTISGDTLIVKDENTTAFRPVISTAGADISITGATVNIESTKGCGIKCCEDDAEKPVNPVVSIGGGANVSIKSMDDGIDLGYGGVLTIDGGASVNIESSIDGIYENKGATVSIGGGSTVTINSGDIASGIMCVDGKLTVNGGAKLSIRAGGEALYKQSGDLLITEGAVLECFSKKDNALRTGGAVTIDDGAVASFSSTGTDEGKEPKAVCLSAGNNITINGGKAVFESNYSAISDFSKIIIGKNDHINYLGDSEENKAVVADTAVTGATGKKYLEVVYVYPIKYEYAGGTPVNKNPEEYTLDDEFTLSNPIKDGYDFAGWTGTDLTAATKDVTIKKGSYGPRSYTATWKEAVPEPKPTPEPTPEPKPEPKDELKVTLKKTSSTYNGKTPKIEVKSISFAGKKVSLKAKDYKITYSPKTVKKAGEYTVTLTVKNGKYKGKTGTATYTIKKAANPLTVKRLKKTITVKASEIKSKAKTYKIKNIAKISKQQGKITYEALPGSSDKVIFNTNNGSITVPKGLAKGKYKVKFRVTAAGGTNYKAKSVSLTQTIQVK